MMLATTDGVRDWLKNKFHDYDLCEEPVRGTYGLIWFLRQRSYGNQEFAVKTVPPESLSEDVKSLDHLRREFRLWLRLQHHWNVVSALGFDNAVLTESSSGKDVVIPVMKMPKMDGSLEDWVANKAISTCDRLIAMSQVVNGLMHLYRNGFQGHGDLKPSNLLYSDLSKKFNLESGGTWPSIRNPWLVKVADLGWADAWVDLGFTNKAFRQYLAPERLESIVVPEKSDVFAIGVILAELLLGKHPATNFKKATKSEGNWKKCVEKAEWTLQDIDSERLRSLILKCLDSNPDQRPSPEECLHKICEELTEQHSIHVLETLELWSREKSSIELAEHSAWAAVKVTDLSAVELLKEKRELTERLRSIKVVGFYDCEIWVALAESMAAILNREIIEGAEDEFSSLRYDAIRYINHLLAPATSSALLEWSNRPDWPRYVRPFERYSELVGRMTVLAYGSYSVTHDKLKNASSYFWAALSFAEASEAHSQANTSLALELIEKAMRYSSTEAVLYYFRALWREERWIVDSIRESSENREIMYQETSKKWIADFEKAIELAPEWDEPRLMKYRKKSQG